MTIRYHLVHAQHLVFIAWLVALVATLGAVFIGEVMGRTPCVLCWYQRIAMFPLALILGTAFINNDGNVWRYALPISLVGGAIACWHLFVYAGVVPEAVQPCSRAGPSCSGADMTLFGIVPIPLLSLAAFGIIVFTLALAKGKARHE